MPDERVLTQVVEAVAMDGGFSGAVRVVSGAGVLVELACGYANRSSEEPNRLDTRFGIASGGKLFTALGIGLLLDQGLLDLDAPIAAVIDHRLPNLSEDVTVRHLLTHTSGVYDYYDEEADTDFDNFELAVSPYKLVDLSDYLPLLARGDAKFAPGSRFSYSNSGYVLLGLAIEALSETPYHRFIEQRVLAPAGMTSSGFFRFDCLPPRVATGYIEQEQQWRSNIYMLPIIGGPDGGMLSTVGDIERMWRTLLPGKLLTPELTASFLAPAVTWKQDIHYGHGVWICDRPPGHRRIYIEGCDAGVSFKSTCYDDHTFATVMSNTTEGAWPVADAIDALYDAVPGAV